MNICIDRNNYYEKPIGEKMAKKGIYATIDKNTLIVYKISNIIF